MLWFDVTQTNAIMHEIINVVRISDSIKVFSEEGYKSNKIERFFKKIVLSLINIVCVDLN